MKQAKPQKIVLMVIWLAIVCTSLIYAVLNIKKHVVWSVGAILIATAMLVIFVVDNSRKAASRKNEAIGDYAVLILILGGVIVLIATLVAALISRSWLAVFIVGLFLTVFIPILRDYIKHLKRKTKKNRTSSPSSKKLLYRDDRDQPRG